MADSVIPPPLVLMSVSVLLGNLLRGALTSLGNMRVVAEANPLNYRGVPPNLVLVEVTTETEAWVHQLLEQGANSPLVLIGPLGKPAERSRRQGDAAPPSEVRELSADVSVAEIVRVCSEYLGSTPTVAPRSLRSVPSNPFDFEVMPREPGGSLPSLQAPLFPVSAPPSSHPSKRPSSGAPAAGPVGVDSDSSGFELAPELSTLLAETEARIASEMSPRLTSPPEPGEEGARGEQFFLSPEVRAALEDPVERFHDKGARELSHHSGTPNSQWATRTGTSHTGRRSDLISSAVTSSATADLGPLPPAVNTANSPASRTGANEDSDSHHSVSLEPHPSAPESSSTGATTRPPPAAVSRKALLAPAVPPPPGLPQDPWHTHLDGNTPVELEEHVSSNAEPPRQVAAKTFAVKVPQDARPTHQPGSRTSNASSGSLHFPGPTAPTAAHDTAQPSAPDFEVALPPGPVRASELPPLAEGDMVGLLARAIRTRYTGTIVVEADGGVRRLVLRDGDFVTAASGLPHESLLSFLVAQGTLAASVAHRLEHRLPNFGRHAGAALIAAGHLTQEQLWPCLRGHAEHIIAATLRLTTGVAGFEDQIAERLANEPAVFGGATGAEVFVELVRRVVAQEVAVQRLGGLKARLTEGSAVSLLEECALSRSETEAVGRCLEGAIVSLSELLAAQRSPELAATVYALCQLRVLHFEPGQKGPATTPRQADPLDEQAVRELVANRKALVEEGDYFQVLGLTHQATAYDIRRAYLELKRTFQAGRLLTPEVTDLRDDVDLISSVLDEAYDILHDQTRRERYRRALLSSPE